MKPELNMTSSDLHLHQHPRSENNELIGQIINPPFNKMSV